MIFAFFYRMTSAKHTIPAYQIYDRMCVMRHQPQSGRHSNCKDAYQSWYHAHLEQLAHQFDISLEINDNKWLPSMKAELEKQWHTTYQQHMQNNESMWAKVYSAF